MTDTAAAVDDAKFTPGDRSQLPWVPLLAFALAGFMCIMTETMPAGLLTQISDDLDVSEAAAGQWVTLYAAGTVIAALPAVTLTRGLRRKPLLVASAIGFLIANGVTAATPNFSTALVARAIAGAFSGLVWGILPGYARRLVSSQHAGRALAIAMVGTPVALSIGTPLGTLLGSVMGWRWTFALMSFAALILIAWAILGVPDRPGQARGARTPLHRVIALPGVIGILATTLAWLLAHNLLYTYIAPYLNWTGATERVDLVLFAFGVAALAGIWFTGVFIDRALRALVLGGTAAFAVLGTGLGIGGHYALVLWISVAVWGFAFGGAATQIQTAHADAAQDDVDIVMGMNTTAFNLAIFAGGALGGILLNACDPGVFPWLVAGLAVIALMLTIFNRKGFMPGPRGR